MSRIITNNMTVVYDYDQNSKHQSERGVSKTKGRRSTAAFALCLQAKLWGTNSYPAYVRVLLWRSEASEEKYFVQTTCTVLALCQKGSKIWTRLLQVHGTWTFPPSTKQSLLPALCFMGVLTLWKSYLWVNCSDCVRPVKLNSYCFIFRCSVQKWFQTDLVNTP